MLMLMLLLYEIRTGNHERLRRLRRKNPFGGQPGKLHRRLALWGLMQVAKVLMEGQCHRPQSLPNGRRREYEASTGREAELNVPAIDTSSHCSPASSASECEGSC
uniref:Uncharacterized protein n=1 Tax=Eutreptiella gymnastica TaxID=73025 RepID=A0A7S4C9I0_9EUGL